MATEPPSPSGTPPVQPGERTDPGMGSARGPSREQTVLGVGAGLPGDANEATVAPVVVLAPKRERTVLGVAPSAAPPGALPPHREISLQEPPSPEGWDLPEEAATVEPERSIPLDLVPSRRSGAPGHALTPARDPSIAVDLSELEPSRKEPSLVSTPNEPSLVPAGVPRHRGRKLLLALAVVAAAGAVAYVEREPLRPLWNRLPLKALHLR